MTEKWALILLGVAVAVAFAVAFDWDRPCFAGLGWAGLRWLAGFSDALFPGSAVLGLVMKGLLFSSLPKTAIVRRFARVWTPVLPVNAAVVSLLLRGTQ